MGPDPEKKDPSLGAESSAGPLPVLLVVPVYNHGATLSGVVRAALATGLPVLVVDDGSNDGGSEGLEQLDCVVHRLPENRGKGAALLTAARLAAEQGYRAMVSVDADGQHDPADALRLLAEAAAGAWPAIIIGARQMVEPTVPKSSLFGRAFSNFWVRLECGADLADTQSGLRLYPLPELLALPLSRSRYDFEVEVVVKAVWAGLDVRSVPVSVHYPPAGDRVSHFRGVVDNWRLTRLHTLLFCRCLLPLPHPRVVPPPPRGATAAVATAKKPWQTLKRLTGEHSSPFWLAVAVWLGIFLGALPLIGVHTVVVIYFSCRLHVNSVAAVAASQFCMPPLVPVLCIEVGSFLRRGELILDLSWQRWLLEIHQRLFDWFLGSLLVGPLLGFVGGGLVYWGSRRLQLRRGRLYGGGDGGAEGGADGEADGAALSGVSGRSGESGLRRGSEESGLSGESHESGESGGSGGGRGLAKRLEGLGHWFFYLSMRLFGHRGGIALLAPVMGCYLLGSRRIHRLSRHYLRRRFPGAGRFALWRHTFYNLFSFGLVLVERGWLGVDRQARLKSDFPHRDRLAAAIARGKGVVLLTAHVGNWQSALAHLGELPVPVHAIMRYDQQAAAKHFFDLRPGPPPFSLINAEGDFGGMVEALAALQRGEVVTIMGDRYVGGPAATVDFFATPVRLPVAAYQLAAMAGAPVLVLLAAQSGHGRCRLQFWEDILPAQVGRAERPAMLADCAGRFSRALEEFLHHHPYQWYNFYNFWRQ